MSAPSSPPSLPESGYIRFQSPTRSGRGHFPGVFALTNGLAREGRLSASQHAVWRASNDWYDTHVTNPTTVDPTVYDPALNPGAAAWFRATATGLLARVVPYLEILSAHGIPCVRLETRAPGRIVYEDADQVVAVPPPYATSYGSR
ncbi:hypothetical protein [Streptomyces sp. NPDC047981]|uniref:hypothetical protein n=1 Tax=Streptomyces sp. NPDC047981 TaxID=3154610 RepID=UPI0034432097